jgi:transcriptional regulator with XRE-family HTH domain
MKAAENVDLQGLAQALKAKMRALPEHLQNLNHVSNQTGVSASTLSRTIRVIGMPEIDTIHRLAHWLGVPLTRFVKDGRQGHTDMVAYLPDEETPSKVAALLRHDESLSPQAATAISEMFRVAYDLAISEQKGKGVALGSARP